MKNTNNYPLISIAMCLYNGEEFLKSALNSLSSLKYSNYEIIILDNQSTDKSIKIVKDFITINPRIKLYIDSQQRNGYDGYTEIINYCSGEYIINFNDDDLISDDALNILYDEIKYSNSDGVFANGHFMNRNGDKLSNFFNSNFNFNKLNLDKKLLLFYKLRFNVPFLFGLFNKKKILDILPYDNIDQTLQDTDTLFAAKIIANLKINYLNKNLHFYRQYADHDRWHDPVHGNLNYLNSMLSTILFQIRHETILLMKYKKLIKNFSISIFAIYFYNLIKKTFLLLRN